MGLSFSVPEGIKIPSSLVNIFKELKQDLGCSIPSHGNLERWAVQGVLLLNTVLTVSAQVWNKKNFEQPIFVKYIFASEAIRDSKLPIPAPFCRRYLPVVDTMMTLETENGELYEAKYLPRGINFSGGWGRFAFCEKLAQDDVAVFHLVGSTKFKQFALPNG